MQYLITGATGFIGPYLLQRLTSEGHHCRCLVRPGSENKLIPNSNIEVVPGDITRPGTLSGIGKGIDRLLHLATLGHMSNYTMTEEMFEAINVQGTCNIMQEAQNAGIEKIVHCSSVAAMGICDEVPATEQSLCTPHHAYGKSKLKTEKKILAMVEKDLLPATIVRFSMVYGPGDPRDILKLTRMAKRGLWPMIGNRSKLTPLIHAADAVEGLLLAAEHGRSGEIYLITNKESLPFDRIKDIIQDALGIKRPILYIPETAALILASAMERIYTSFGKTPLVTRKNIESTLADRVFSIEKAQKELGFAPAVDPVEGLRETVQWFKEQGWV